MGAALRVAVAGAAILLAAGVAAPAAGQGASSVQERGGADAPTVQDARAAQGAPEARQVRSGGDGLIYLGTYAQSIYVLDERDLSVRDRIPLESGIPGDITPGASGERLYVETIDYEHVEIIDRIRGESVGVVSLSEGGEQVRLRGLAVHPDDRSMVLLVRRYEKLADRWRIGEPELLLYDLVEDEVARAVPWPDGEPSDNLSFRFSPDGRHLYFFEDDVRIYETEGYTEVGRWDYSRALDGGMGEFDFGFPASLREEEGWHTGLFRIEEPVQDRELLGIARANPTLREVDWFFALGPVETGPRSRVSFALAPGRERAYGLHQEVENYQLWTFDLEQRSAEAIPFDGRPRMELEVSSNGELVYIYNAGNTIDVYDADTLELLRTVELDADTLTDLWILPRFAGADGGG